jgi:hypothetical protein
LRFNTVEYREWIDVGGWDRVVLLFESSVVIIERKSKCVVKKRFELFENLYFIYLHAFNYFNLFRDWH